MGGGMGGVYRKESRGRGREGVRTGMLLFNP